MDGDVVRPLSRLVVTFEDGETRTLLVTRNPKKILTMEWMTPDTEASIISERSENALVKW